jgi:hypothetical protein
MSRNEYLFQSRSVCAFLLVCISLCPSVFAGDYCSSSWRGFDSNASATELNSASPSSMSLQALIQVVPAVNNADDACQAFRETGALLTWKSNAGSVTLDVSLVDGLSLTATEISAFEGILPANTLWTWGQYEVMLSFTNSSAEKIAAAYNPNADKQMLHVIRIADSGTSSLLASGTGLLKQI